MEMTEERFALVRPAIFGALCDLAVNGLRDLPGIQLPKLPPDVQRSWVATLTGRRLGCLV